jgi:hypothetical protein
LIRVDDDWRLIEATTVEALYARARASVPPSWELPLGLRSNEETRR